MTELDGPQAFTALAEVLGNERGAEEFRCPEGTPAERLRRALGPDASLSSSADLAVLLRHALRTEDTRRRGGTVAMFRIPSGSPLDHPDLWRRVGVNARRSGLWVELTALPWKPSWLPGSEKRAVDESACAAYVDTPRRIFDTKGPPDDPFLGLFGYVTYRSVGQRAGLRSALLTPSGDTLVVDLPTSDGKSLVFRAIDALGFASDDEARQGSGGVTLVVVPTVALALDHAANCQLGRIGDPIAYIGGARNADRNQTIRERVAQGIQGLCFVAPEAAVGPLRWPLIQAARRGALKALVVDEAHLVDAWGTGFRTEFQQLAGLRLELLEASPANQKPRTLLLSATLSESARETLEDLFGKPGRFKVVSAPQVRPEPEFWVAPECYVEERDQRVSEAVHRTPRPAILYVTKVADANRWYAELRASGFTRLGRITGETPSDERARVLDRWRRGTLDLVVATSAFGLGVDYPYVRTILHACVPESLDRFYQEVGRGGRDGRACLSLIMPAERDLRVARELSNRVTISIERGLQRWTAMFRHADRRQISWNRFRVRLDVPPGYDEDEIDMLSGRSTDWNARTLVLMARSGLIRFCGQAEEEIQKHASEQIVVDEVEGVGSETRGEYEAVEIVDSAHLDRATWEEKVIPVRDRLFAAGQKNLELLRQLLKSEDCPADLVANLYGPDMVDKVCGGCALCRSDLARQRKPDPRREPVPPWPPASSLAAALAELCDEGRLIVFYEPAAQGRRAERVARETLRGLVRLGLRLIGLVGTPAAAIGMALSSLTDRPVFVARGTRTFDCRLPDGPRVLIYGEDAGIAPSDLGPRPRGREQLLFLSQRAPGAYRRDLLLRDTWSGARISLGELHGRIGL